MTSYFLMMGFWSAGFVAGFLIARNNYRSKTIELNRELHRIQFELRLEKDTKR